MYDDKQVRLRKSDDAATFMDALVKFKQVLMEHLRSRQVLTRKSGTTSC